jgi:hypothetical protein
VSFGSASNTASLPDCVRGDAENRSDLSMSDLDPCGGSRSGIRGVPLNGGAMSEL